MTAIPAVLRSLVVHPPPLAVGAPAPELSLTADDGSWVRADDHVGRRPLVLVFFRTQGSPDYALLQAFDRRRAEIEAHEAVLVGINQDRPDALREHRARSGVGFPLLYDLLATTARLYGQSGRRPYVRSGVVVIDRQGRIALHTRDEDPVADVIAALTHDGETEGSRVAGRPLDIEWSEATPLIRRDDHVVLDVRTRGEFASLHVPGAVHIPLDELPTRYGELGQTRRVLCVCQTGGRGSAAAAFLASVGFTQVYNVLGGMTAWPGNE